MILTILPSEKKLRACFGIVFKMVSHNFQDVHFRIDFFFCLPLTKDMKIKTKTHLSFFFYTKRKTLRSRFAFFIFILCRKHPRPKKYIYQLRTKTLDLSLISLVAQTYVTAPHLRRPSPTLRLKGDHHSAHFLPKLTTLVLGLLLSDFLQVYTFRAFPLFCEHESQYLGLFSFSYMGII